MAGYIAYNDRSAFAITKDQIPQYKNMIVIKSHDVVADVSKIISIIKSKNVVKGNSIMDLSIITDPNDISIVKSMKDFLAIRAILKKYGITGCSFCDYGDKDIAEWIIFNEEEGRI